MRCAQCGRTSQSESALCQGCGLSLDEQGGPPSPPQPSVIMQQPARQPPAIPKPTAFAGFWRRFAAHVVDLALVATGSYAVLFIAMFAVVAPSDLLRVGAQMDPYELLTDPAVGKIGMVVLVWMGITLAGQWLYFAIMESSRLQATLGKLALGIIVTDASGHRISFGRATARYWSKMISGLILLAGYVMAAFTPKRQALHDLVVDTVVVIRTK